MRRCLCVVWSVLFLLLPAVGMSQSPFQPVSIVLAWLPLTPDWMGEPAEGGEQLTYWLNYQLGTRDGFRFVSLAPDTEGSFLDRLEKLLIEAAHVPTLTESSQRAVILALGGDAWEPEDASVQARQLTLMRRITQLFLQRGVRLYGIATGDPPHSAFLIRLATACNVTDGVYWFKARNTSELINAYARILLDLRQIDPSLYRRSRLPFLRVALAAAIVMLTLAGMAGLTWRFAPREWFSQWWKRREKKVDLPEDDLAAEVETVILGSVPAEAGDESA